MKKEIKGSAIETVDTVSAEKIVAGSEIKAVTAVNKNYESGVYSWYRKSFKTKAKAFKYLWNKRGSYKGTTNFIFQIEVDGEKIFNWDSAAKDYALEINDEEIQKLYEEEEIKEEAAEAIAESKNYVKFSKEFPKEFEAMLRNRREAKMSFLAKKLKRMKEEIEAKEEAMLGGVVSVEAQEAAVEAEIENAVESTNTPIETVDTKKAENIVRFEVGKTYIAKMDTEDGSYTNYLEVMRRTAKTLTFKDVYGHLFKGVRFQECDGCEYASGGFGYTFSDRVSEDTREEIAVAVIEGREDEVMTEYAYEAVRLMFDEIQDMAIQLDEEVNINELPEKTVEESLFEAVQLEIENAVSEEVTVNSDITDAAMSEVEKEPEISTAELEKQLAELEKQIDEAKEHKEFTRVQIKAEWKIIMQFISNIMRHENEIAELNALYCDAEKELAEFEETAAKIKAEIHNRQFNASALMTAINAAEKVPAVAPVSFDLQHFNEVIIAENAATIDTAVSKTEIPYIDEDAEFDAETEKLADEIEDCDMDIANIDVRIEELQAEIRKLENLRYSKYRQLKEVKAKNRSRAKTLQEWACNEVKFGDKEILLKGRNKKYDRINGEESFEDNFAISIEGNGAIWCYLWRSNIKLGEYHTVKAFKAAISELAAAIERGDTEFTFPADK